MSHFRSVMIALSLATCGGAAIAAQTAIVDRSYNVGSFDKVAAAGPNLVIVHVGGASSVSARGPAETLDKMEVVIEHGSLQIRPREQYRNHFDWHGMKPATFSVTMPRVTDAAQAGSGEMRIDRAEGRSFAGSLAGSGRLDIASLKVDNANLSTAGSGDLTAHGSATRANLSIAGSGNVRARGVTSQNASVSIAGSGTAELSAQQAANVSIVGSGDAVISGPAKCHVSRIGSGRARCNA